MDASLIPAATQVLRHVIPPTADIGCNTFLPHEYFRTRLKACNYYCMQELQRVACNNCTWNYGISHPSYLL